MSGHFEVIEVGNARVARFDTSPQTYSRNARLVNNAGSNDFMFDFQLAGRSLMVQGAREGLVNPGLGVLYDARRPFEDVLDNHSGQRAEVLIVTVPAESLTEAFSDAERLCASPIPLSGVVARTIMRFLRSVLVAPINHPIRSDPDERDLIDYLVALLRHTSGSAHGLNRWSLFALVDIHIQQSLGEVRLTLESGRQNLVVSRCAATGRGLPRGRDRSRRAETAGRTGRGPLHGSESRKPSFGILVRGTVQFRQQQPNNRTLPPSHELMQFACPGDNQGDDRALIAAPRQSQGVTVTRGLPRWGLHAIMMRYGCRFSS